MLATLGARTERSLGIIKCSFQRVSGVDDIAVRGAEKVEIELDPVCPSGQRVNLLGPLGLRLVPFNGG